MSDCGRPEFAGASACESCGDTVRLETLEVEGETIGIFCSTCHQTLSAAVSQLTADATDQDINAFLQEERGAIVELCRQSDQRRN